MPIRRQSAGRRFTDPATRARDQRQLCFSMCPEHAALIAAVAGRIFLGVAHLGLGSKR